MSESHHCPPTLLLFTHERHNYLERALDYYRGSGLQLVVADSSMSAFQKETGCNVQYLHYPGAEWIDKMLDAVSRVKTEYIVLCADDDFVIPSALKKCAAFLDANRDYELAMGYFLVFRNSPEKLTFKIMYPNMYSIDIAADNGLERLRQFYQNYIQTVYVVRRTQLLLDILKRIKQADIQGKLILQIESVLSIVSGKMKVIPEFFGVREYIANSHSARLTSLDEIYSAPEHQALMDKFYSVCTAYLVDKENMPRDIARHNLAEIYGEWMQQRSKGNPDDTGPVIKKIRKIIRRFTMKQTRRRDEQRYNIKFKNEAGDLEFNEGENSRELERIRMIIKSHDIRSF